MTNERKKANYTLIAASEFYREYAKEHHFDLDFVRYNALTKRMLARFADQHTAAQSAELERLRGEVERLKGELVMLIVERDKLAEADQTAEGE